MASGSSGMVGPIDTHDPKMRVQNAGAGCHWRLRRVPSRNDNQLREAVEVEHDCRGFRCCSTFEMSCTMCKSDHARMLLSSGLC